MRNKRKKIKNQNIDEFVLERTEEFSGIYNQYKDNILNLRGVVFVRYEDMISNPKNFITKLYNILDIDINNKDIDKIVKDRMIMPKEEQKYSHRRSGKSGQYLDKLKPETIRIINLKFENIISVFGFDK
jgi:hypothetical protein